MNHSLYPTGTGAPPGHRGPRSWRKHQLYRSCRCSGRRWSWSCSDSSPCSSWWTWSSPPPGKSAERAESLCREIRRHNLKTHSLITDFAYRLPRIVEAQDQYEVLVLLHQVLVQAVQQRVHPPPLMMMMMAALHDLHTALFTFYSRTLTCQLSHALAILLARVVTRCHATAAALHSPMRDITCWLLTTSLSRC